MDSATFVGMDVHKETISILVMNSAGKLIMESIVETKVLTILQFIQGLRGDLHVTFEEETWAAWLYGLLRPHITKVVVCNPRKTALLKEGSKSDRIDARNLAELLRNGSLSMVYHGENGISVLKELCRSYLTISKDLGVASGLALGQTVPGCSCFTPESIWWVDQQNRRETAASKRPGDVTKSFVADRKDFEFKVRNCVNRLGSGGYLRRDDRAHCGHADGSLCSG
jgi:hypothetical protein